MTSGDPPRRSFPPASPSLSPVPSPAPGRPWSDLETSHLITAYYQVWHSLNRGHLKGHHWDQVAAVAAQLSVPHHLPRTGTQCRHKMEKLRKRYREERKLVSRPSHWPHFDQIDRLERGLQPKAPRPLQQLQQKPQPDEDSEEDEDEDDEDGGGEDGDGEDEEGALGSLVRRLEEGFVRVEKRRSEMMREMARDWMRMEEKRTEMMAEAERWMVDTIARAFKKPRRPSHEND